MPEYHIRQHFGKAPDEVFEKVGFSGNHSKTIALVQSGAYQVGAVNFKVWEQDSGRQGRSGQGRRSSGRPRRIPTTSGPFGATWMRAGARGSRTR